MSDFEYAFYTAVASNDSARELMQQDKLRELAIELCERAKANACIDWAINESVKAKLKIVVIENPKAFCPCIRSTETGNRNSAQTGGDAG